MSTMNLLPDSYVKKRFRNRINMVCVVIFTFIMAVMILVELFSGSKNTDVQSDYVAASEEFKGTADFLKKDFFLLQGRKSAMLREAEAAAEKEDLIPRSYVLSVVTNACPPNLSLTEVFLKTTDPNKETGKKVVKRVSSAAPVEEKPKLPLFIEVDVEGLAKNDSDVTMLYSTLKSHPLVKIVQLQYTREEGAGSRSSRSSSKGRTGSQEDAQPLREFAIHMELHSKVDVKEIIKKQNTTMPPPAEISCAREGGGR